MAHYALLDKNNFVVQVIVGRDEDEVIDGINDWEAYYGEIHNLKCVRTSYNAKIRKNFAGVGYFYDLEKDAFIPPSRFDSWVLNEETCRWEAPVAYPTDGRQYYWDEQVVDWTPMPNDSEQTT